MRGFDVAKGVGERGELLYGVLLPLVGSGPVPHRRHRRRLFGRRVVGSQDSDELVDPQRLVVGEAGVGLPDQPGGGVRTQRPDR